MVLDVFSSASGYCIHSMPLPQENNLPPKSNPKTEISHKHGRQGKTEFLSLQCGAAELTLTAQWDN